MLTLLTKPDIMIFKNYLSKNLQNSHIITAQDNSIISTYTCFTRLTFRLSQVDSLSRYVKKLVTWSEPMRFFFPWDTFIFYNYYNWSTFFKYTYCITNVQIVKNIFYNNKKKFKQSWRFSVNFSFQKNNSVVSQKYRLFLLLTLIW